MALLEPIYGDLKATELIEKPDVFWPDEVDSPNDDTVKKLVVQDVMAAEDYLKTRNLPNMWDEADRLYQASLPVEYWPGTRVERAHLGIPITAEHINALVPQVMQELFGDDLPFIITPMYGDTEADHITANQYIFDWELERTKFKRESELIIFDAHEYGTGIGKWGWKVEENRQKKFGDDRKGMDTIGRPYFERCELRHILVDPSLRIADIREARWVAHRTYMTPLQLDKLRSDDRYNIPSRDALKFVGIDIQEMVQQPKTEFVNRGDLTPEFRFWPKNIPFSADPLQKPLEVLEYTTNEWIFTVLQRKLVIKKERNVWGRINYCSVPFRVMPNSFYGIGIAGLVGGEQMLQQGLLNIYLDNKSLQMNMPFLRRRGSNIHAQQLRLAPGRIIDVDDVQTGVAPVQLPESDPNIQNVMQSSDQRATRRTGAQELVVQGSLGQASSITRTAQGVQALQSAAGANIQHFIEIFAEQVFVPTLEAFNYMNDQLDPKIVKQIIGQDEKIKKLDPKKITSLVLNFKIGTASKLRRRAAMGQTLPTITQFLQSQPITDQLKSQQKVLNIESLIDLWFDMTAYGPYENILVRDMTQEEVSQMMSESPMAIKLAQLKDQRDQLQVMTDAKKQVIETENMGRAGRDIIKGLITMAQEGHSNEQAQKLLADAANAMFKGMAQQDSIQAQGDYFGRRGQNSTGPGQSQGQPGMAAPPAVNQ